MFFVWLLVSFVVSLRSFFPFKNDKRKLTKKEENLISNSFKQNAPPLNIGFHSSSLMFIVYAYMESRFCRKFDFKIYITSIVANCKEFFHRYSSDLSVIDSNIRSMNKDKKDKENYRECVENSYIYCLLDYIISGKQNPSLFKLLPQLLADTFDLEFEFLYDKNILIVRPFSEKIKATVHILIEKNCDHYSYQLHNNAFLNCKSMEGLYNEWCGYNSKRIYNIIREDETLEKYLKHYPQGLFSHISLCFT